MMPELGTSVWNRIFRAAHGIKHKNSVNWNAHNGFLYILGVLFNSKSIVDYV